MEKSETYYLEKHFVIKRELNKLYKKYKFNPEKNPGVDFSYVGEEVLDLTAELLVESMEVLKKLHIIQHGYEWKDVPDLKIVVNNE